MTTNYQILHKDVYYFPGIISNIQEILEEIEVFDSVSVSPWGIWYAGNTPDSHPYGDLKTFKINLLGSETDPELKSRAENLIFSIINPMEESCRIFLEGHGVSERELSHLHSSMYEDNNVYGIRKYNPDESMGPHQDMVDLNRDTITISVYLNDDYEGGEIAVVEPGVDVSVKAQAGSILVFPSSYNHESRQLFSGRKIIITHVHMALGKIGIGGE